MSPWEPFSNMDASSLPSFQLFAWERQNRILAGAQDGERGK